MRIAILGMGRMGANMARRLLGHGHQVVGWNRTPAKVDELAGEGIRAAREIADLAAQLERPRVAWMMVPAGAATQLLAEDLLESVLQPGDVLVDGANSFWKDSMVLAEYATQRQVHFLDAGVSGGIWGLEEGYCLMVGGAREAFKLVEPVLRDLAPSGGYALVGPSGAGHFAKMVHNGIEYGLLQAYGEGFELLHSSRFGLDLHQLAALWGQGSVVRSWLLELLERALERDAQLTGIRGYVEDSGEGRWTVQYAVEAGVPATAIAHALFARFLSRQEDSFSAKIIAALRNEFGGHAVRDR